MTDAAISDTLEALAGSLDRLAALVCDAGATERAAVLTRLQRLHADLDATVAAVEHNISRADPTESR